MSGPDFVSADWLSEEPLSVREHSSDHRFAVSMRDLAAANGLFLSEGQERRACCELVWRGAPEDWGYAVFAGLKDVSSFVQNLYFTPEDIRILSGMRLFSDGFLEYLARYRFRGSMSSVPEGTVVFPGEPVLTLSGGLIDVQLFESALCCLTGRASYIATKASRLAGAAGGRAVFVSDGSDATHCRSSLLIPGSRVHRRRLVPRRFLPRQGQGKRNGAGRPDHAPQLGACP